MPLLKRLARRDLAIVPFTLDGVPCEGRAGDTVLTAALTLTEQLRFSDFSRAPRAGFCQMGACQDCWILTGDGTRLRACTTLLVPGMDLRTCMESIS
jgi:D-hydroxyproline dehydrogenase subunit gamma